MIGPHRSESSGVGRLGDESANRARDAFHRLHARRRALPSDDYGSNASSSSAASSASRLLLSAALRSLPASVSARSAFFASSLARAVSSRARFSSSRRLDSRSSFLRRRSASSSSLAGALRRLVFAGSSSPANTSKPEDFSSPVRRPAL